MPALGVLFRQRLPMFDVQLLTLQSLTAFPSNRQLNCEPKLIDPRAYTLMRMSPPISLPFSSWAIFETLLLAGLLPTPVRFLPHLTTRINRQNDPHLGTKLILLSTRQLSVRLLHLPFVSRRLIARDKRVAGSSLMFGPRGTVRGCVLMYLLSMIILGF